MKGIIPEVFAGNSPERIAYLHIDMNQAPAELAALEHLFDRPGAGRHADPRRLRRAMAYRGQKLAEDP